MSIVNSVEEEQQMKEQLTQSIFDYLLKLSNGQLLLTPEQLEKVVGIKSKQQSSLRQEKKFPIAYQKIGKLVFYSISDVVDYLINGKSQVVEEKKDAIKEVIVSKKSSKAVTDVSSIFMMKSFASVLEEEGQQLIELSYNLVKYAESHSLYEKLNVKLSRKNTTQLTKEKVRKE